MEEKVAKEEVVKVPEEEEEEEEEEDWYPLSLLRLPPLKTFESLHFA